MGSPRLLLVEDEPALADLLKRYLERLGYQVDACAQADAALTLLDAHPEDYALLITDLSLPDMSGDELMTRSRLRAPHLRAIIASGYPYEPRVVGRRVSAETFLAQFAGGSGRAGAQGLRILNSGRTARAWRTCRTGKMAWCPERSQWCAPRSWKPAWSHDRVRKKGTRPRPLRRSAAPVSRTCCRNRRTGIQKWA